jgi:hypothetical protein
MTMRYDVETLRELLARVETATRPDRKLGYDILRLLHPEWKSYADEQFHDNKFYSPRITSSIDAAVGLIERVLPGRYWATTGQWNVEGGKHTPGAQIDAGCFPIIITNAATPALALCAAMLHALITIEDALEKEEPSETRS